MMTHIIDGSELQGLPDSLLFNEGDKTSSGITGSPLVTSTKENTSNKEENTGSQLLKLLTSTSQPSTGQHLVSGRFHPYKDISSPNSVSHCVRCKTLNSTSDSFVILPEGAVIFNVQRIAKPTVQLGCLNHYLCKELDGSVTMEYLLSPSCCRGNLLFVSTVYSPQVVANTLKVFLVTRKLVDHK